MSRKSRKQDVTPPMSAGVRITLIVSAAIVLAAVAFTWRGQRVYAHKLPAAAAKKAAGTVTALDGRIQFHDVKRQSREFIGYYHSIKLTPEQEAVKAKALTSRPAACCRNSNAHTCCCTCNLSKSVWGLANYAIAKHHATADDLNAVVDAWLGFVNPDGFDGETCYRGACGLPGAQKGCGGMSENDITI